MRELVRILLQHVKPLIISHQEQCSQPHLIFFLNTSQGSHTVELCNGKKKLVILLGRVDDKVLLL